MITENVVAFDTETYYTTEYSLSKMSVFEYVNSPLFNCYFISIYTPTFHYEGPPEEFDWSLLHGKTLPAHNALFDSLVFEKMQEKGIVPKDVKPDKFICTADMVAYLRCMRSLAKASAILLGVTLEKETRGAMKGKVWNDIKGTDLGEKFLKYVGNDAKYCYLLWEKYHDQWPENEQRISIESREGGKRGIRVDWPKLEEGLTTLQETLFEAERAIPWDWSDRKTPLSPIRIREECRKVGIWAPASFAMSNEKCDEWIAEFSDKHAWIMAIREWRRVNMATQKVKSMQKNRIPGTDRMAFALKYFGAHPGRWSGDQKYNIQNLPREPMFGIDMRGFLLPDADDEEFIIADYTAIEPTVLCWLVGDTEMLDLVRQGIGIYHAYVVKNSGWPMEKDFKKESKLTEEGTKFYGLTKARVISLGYGCGHKKFVTQARTFGIELSLSESLESVNGYRAENPRVQGFWSARQQGLVFSAANHDASYEIGLPSGRSMIYFEPKSVKGKYDDGKPRSEYAAKQWQGGNHIKLYGGKITENVDQAISRDILVDGWLKLIDAGFKVKFTTHDEFVVSEKKMVSVDSMKRMEEILTQPPAWLPDFPLGVEIGLHPRYTKA